MKGKTKRILVVVVKWRHCANGLLTIWFFGLFWVGVSWVPEGFFPVVGCETAAEPRSGNEREKPSGHGSYEPHFHVILKQDGWPNRFFVGSVCFRNLICLNVGQWCVKRARNVVKLRNGEFREQCFHNSGEKIDVCTSSPDRGFAANNRKKTLAPRVGSGLRQIELNGTVLGEHYNNNNNDNNNIHLYSAFLLVTQSALQLVNT